MDVMFSLNGLNFEDFFEFREWTNLNFPVHCHYSAEFIFCRAGEVRIEKENERFTLQKGDMLAVMPFEKHSFITENTSEVFIFQLSPKLISNFDTLFKNRRPQNPKAALTDAELSDAYERLANGNCNIVEINYLFFGAMSRVLKNGELVFFEGGDDLFCKVLIFVDRFYEENITLKSAAKEMGVSYEYLSRMFTKKSGMNFSEFLNTFRLQKATAMLSDKNLSISETGYRCGFGSIRNFNKVFLKYKNCTPSRFRSGLKFTKQ